MKSHPCRAFTTRGAQFKTIRTLVASLAAISVAGSVVAGSIGLKFGINGNGNLQNTASGALSPTDYAGTYEFMQPNWNVLGRWGDSSTSYGTNAFPIYDSSGAEIAVTVHWDATGTWSQAGGGTPTVQPSADGNLMNTYCDSNGNGNVPLTNGLSLYGQNVNNKPMVYLSGLRAWLASQGADYYDVVVYSDGDASSGRVGEYWLVNASGATANLTFGDDLSTHTFICDRANYVNAGLYSQVPATVGSGRLAQQGNFQGNYAVFPSLTNDSFLLRTAEFNSRSPINALQIVARTTPLPAVLDPVLPATVYSGANATFRAVAAGVTPMVFQWQKNGANLADGGNVSGANTASLSIRNVSTSDAGAYSVVVSNAIGAITSAPAALTVTAPAAGSYAEKIFANHPVAYWRFNDHGDPSTNYAVANDFVGGFSGVYGSAAYNAMLGVAGPNPAAFPGFEPGNGALQTANADHAWVIAPPLNLNTNTVTMMAWIYPTAWSEPGSAGLIFARTSNNDVNGLDYQNNDQLGYTWNGSASTYNFASRLVVPSNMWSFVALVLSPTNAVVYLYNANGQLSATNTTTHTNALFAAPTLIGCDPSDTTTPRTRAFIGSIDEAAVFNYCLSPLELYNLYKKGLGLTYQPVSITRQPGSTALYQGRTARFSVTAVGDPTITYRWRKDGLDLADDARISGATTANLSISGLTAADAGNYQVVVANLSGPVTSAAATLTVVTPPAPLTAYETALQAADPAGYWRLNEAAGATYAYDYWGGNVATNENVTTGVAGPQPADFVGFESANTGGQYLTADTDTGVDYLNNAAQFTIVGWFNVPGMQTTRTGLFGQNDVAEFGFHGADASGAAQLGIWTSGGGGAYLPQSLIVPGQWHFTAAVGDGSRVSLYLFWKDWSGAVQVAKASSDVTTTNYGASTFSFKIGGGGILDSTGNYVTGSIDEVAVFKRALSGSELSGLFGAATGVQTVPPTITTQPVGLARYAGLDAVLHAEAVGSAPLSYQWRSNGVALADFANVTGSASPTLVITNLAAFNAADYDLVVANAAGKATSSVATLTVVLPGAAGYDAAIVALRPLAYYRLGETTGPSAFDYVGGHTGTYGAGAVLGVPGPRTPLFAGYDTGNLGIQTITNTAGSWVAAPFGSLSTNTATFTMWINPVGAFDSYAGLLVNRGGGVEGGFGYTGGQLGYTWNNNSAGTYNYRSGLVPPLNQWSFVALVVSPADARLYMFNADGQVSATNVLAHTSDVFGNNWQIGSDNSDANNTGARTFNGLIDEVAVFNYSLTPAQLQQLYSVGTAGPVVTLKVARDGNDLVLTWERGTLQYSTDLNGTWSAVAGNPVSGYRATPAPSDKAVFYRVQVK